MGGINIAQYRVTVGYFHPISVKASTMHLSFINVDNIKPFLLILLHGVNGISPALLMYVLFNSTSVTYTPSPTFAAKADIFETNNCFNAPARPVK